MLPSTLRVNGQSPARALDVILRSSLSLVESYGARVHESKTLSDLKRAFQCTIAELEMIEKKECALKDSHPG
jgi:hypothetical protein